MLKDVTLGQFFPGNSLLHRADPRMKIILAMAYIVLVFVAKTTVAYILVVAFTLLTVAVSKLNPTVVLKALKPVLFIMIFTAFFNLFFYRGEGAPLVSIPFFKWSIDIYTKGIVNAVLMVLRVACVITGSCVILTYTTSPIALTDGLERLLAPLKKIHLPVHEFSMMMTIALRFIPTLIEETDKIMNAQKARGADFNSGGLIKRAKALIPVLIPLFASSFRRAGELATAMECRCYRGDKGRTRMTKLRYTKIDFILLFCIILFGAGIIVLNITTASILTFGV